MEQKHRKAIKRNLVNLSRDLDFPPLEPYLVEAEIYPEGRLDAFKAIIEKSKQNVDFLSDIQRRGPKAFGTLIRSLLLTNQEHCANWLDPTGEIAQPQSTIPPSQPPPFRGMESVQDSGGVGNKSQLDEVDLVGQEKPWEDNELSYPMKAYPRGIVLIINNEVFLDDEALRKRDGTNKDCETIENLFRDFLGFLIVKKHNLNLQQMQDLYDVYQAKDHSDYSCFVSVILSHGADGGVCGTDYDKDKKEVLKMEDIVDVMDNCQTLHGKPKVFFTQACRGAKIHQIQVDAIRPEEDIAEERERKMQEEMRNMTVEDNAETEQRQSVVRKTHVGSDVLVAFPAIQGFAAAREADGTWFINSLCEVLREHAHREDLCSMLTIVNRKVGEKIGYLDERKLVTQTSEFTTTLKKKVYFPPVLKNGVPPSS